MCKKVFKEEGNWLKMLESFSHGIKMINRGENVHSQSSAISQKLLQLSR